MFYQGRCLRRRRDRTIGRSGLGDIKVLKHRENGKCRVVMRQENVEGLLNFRLTSSPLVANTTSKSWLFHAFDPLDTEEGAEEGGEGSALTVCCEIQDARNCKRI